MRRLVFVLSAIVATGCAIPVVAPGGGTVRPGPNQPVEPLGGLTFTALTAENARYAGGVAGMPTAAAAPMSTGTTTTTEGSTGTSGGTRTRASSKGASSGNTACGY